VVVVAAIVAINVAIGGMRGTTSRPSILDQGVRDLGPPCLLIIHFGGLPGGRRCSGVVQARTR
jgi:hypothetical protein